eukprot:scaffold77541_cov66-Attheya_sp.AAC.2
MKLWGTIIWDWNYSTTSATTWSRLSSVNDTMVLVGHFGPTQCGSSTRLVSVSLKHGGGGLVRFVPSGASSEDGAADFQISSSGSILLHYFICAIRFSRLVLVVVQTLVTSFEMGGWVGCRDNASQLATINSNWRSKN